MRVYLCAEAIAGRDAWEDETCTRYAVDHTIAYECGPGRTPVVAIHPTTGERVPVDENLNAAANATTPLQGHGTRAATHRASGLGPKDRICRRATPRRKDDLVPGTRPPPASTVSPVNRRPANRLSRNAPPWSGTKASGEAARPPTPTGGRTVSSDTPSPGSIPRNCDATYRGNLGNKPERRQTLSGGEMVRARLAANMAASSVPAEERDRFTEWLTVVCFAPAQMDRLERCEKGELITVNGPVTWREYTPTPTGNRASSTPSSASTFGAHPPRCRPTPAALRTRTRGTCPCDGSRPRNGGGPFRAAARGSVPHPHAEFNRQKSVASNGPGPQQPAYRAPRRDCSHPVS